MPGGVYISFPHKYKCIYSGLPPPPRLLCLFICVNGLFPVEIVNKVSQLLQKWTLSEPVANSVPLPQGLLFWPLTFDPSPPKVMDLLCANSELEVPWLNSTFLRPPSPAHT